MIVPLKLVEGDIDQLNKFQYKFCISINNDWHLHETYEKNFIGFLSISIFLEDKSIRDRS